MKWCYIGIGGIMFLVICCKRAPKGEQAIYSDPKQAILSDTSALILQVDTASSRIEWLGTKIGGSHAGEIRLKGGQLFIRDSLPFSGSFTMNMNSIINTDIPESDPIPKQKLEQHLKGKDFFDVADYPTSTFEITGVLPGEDNNIILSGNLTLRGVSRNITFPASMVQEESDTFKAFADININRQKWGISYKGIQDEMIHDQMNLKVYLVAAPQD